MIIASQLEFVRLVAGKKNMAMGQRLSQITISPEANCRCDLTLCRVIGGFSPSVSRSQQREKKIMFSFIKDLAVKCKRSMFICNSNVLTK